MIALKDKCLKLAVKWQQNLSNPTDPLYRAASELSELLLNHTTDDEVRSLSDADLRYLSRWCNKETRRRKKIQQSNAEWTAGEGIEACLQASINHVQKTKPPHCEECGDPDYVPPSPKALAQLKAGLEND